jgi:multicomponent Na+:H+ antiporter subunit E
MSETMGPLKLFATLLLFWVLLNGSLALGTLGVGVLAAGVVTLMFADGLSFLSGWRWTPKSFTTTVLYVLYFLKELIKANLSLAAVVLNPRLPIRPAIVCTRTTLTHPVGRLLLANSITLTPGTLSVEIDGDKLYVHWVVAQGTDCETATREIVRGFERYLEVMYG